MAVLINGNGNEAIYAQQDADWYAALMGGVTMITAVGEQFAYELLDANTIGVKDGVIITKEGRRIQVDTNVIDTFDIPTGAQGTTNYYIIGYHLVTDEESVQSAETFVQLMDNGTDTIPEGSFKEGDDDVYVSLYRVEQNDLTIGTITLLLPTVSDSMQQQISQISNDLTDKINKSDVVDNLISVSAEAPLSANQGRILNEGLNNALKKDNEYDWNYSDTSATVQQHLFNVRANLTPQASSLSGGIGFAKIHFDAQNSDNFTGFAYFDSTNIYGIISSFSNGIAYSFTCTPTACNIYALKN